MGTRVDGPADGQGQKHSWNWRTRAYRQAASNQWRLKVGFRRIRAADQAREVAADGGGPGLDHVSRALLHVMPPSTITLDLDCRQPQGAIAT